MLEALSILIKNFSVAPVEALQALRSCMRVSSCFASMQVNWAAALIQVIAASTRPASKHEPVAPLSPEIAGRVINVVSEALANNAAILMTPVGDSHPLIQSIQFALCTLATGNTDSRAINGAANFFSRLISGYGKYSYLLVSPLRWLVLNNLLVMIRHVCWGRCMAIVRPSIKACSPGSPKNA